MRPPQQTSSEACVGSKFYYKSLNSQFMDRQVERARAAAAFAQGEAAADATRRAEEAGAEAERAVGDAEAWRARAEAAERELGEVKERAWALLEHKEEELRAVRVRAWPGTPTSLRMYRRLTFP